MLVQNGDFMLFYISPFRRLNTLECGTNNPHFALWYISGTNVR